MTERSDQLEALLSRRGDADLTVDEQAQLRRILADNPAAAADASAYERLNGILAGHRRLPDSVDFRTFTNDLTAQVAEQAAIDASAELDRAIDPNAEDGGASTHRETTGPRFNKTVRALGAVDDLVLEAVGPVPDVDWGAFKTRVSTAIRKEAAAGALSPTEHRWPRVLGWFAPLAAAAAVAAIVWYPRGTVTPGVVDDVRTLTFAFAVDMPDQQGRVAVSFEESNDEAAHQTETAPGGSAIAIAPPPAAFADSADDAYFY